MATRVFEGHARKVSALESGESWQHLYGLGGCPGAGSSKSAATFASLAALLSSLAPRQSALCVFLPLHSRNTKCTPAKTLLRSKLSPHNPPAMPSATSIDFRLVLVGLVLGIIAINPPTLSFLPFLRNGSLHSSTNAHAQSRMRPLYSGTSRLISTLSAYECLFEATHSSPSPADDLAEDIGSVDGSPPAKDFLQRAEQPQPASLSLSEQPRYHELPLYVLNAAASAGQ